MRYDPYTQVEDFYLWSWDVFYLMTIVEHGIWECLNDNYVFWKMKICFENFTLLQKYVNSLKAFNWGEDFIIVPSIYVKHLATSLAFLRMITLVSSCLFQNSHLVLTIGWSDGGDISFQNLFLSISDSFSYIVVIQSECFKAFLINYGSTVISLFS